MLGMCKSRMTASTWPLQRRILSTAICPSSASCTMQPRLSKIRVSTLASSGLSSATSTRTTRNSFSSSTADDLCLMSFSPGDGGTMTHLTGSTRERSRCATSAGLNGFDTYSDMPASRHRSCTPSVTSAVRAAILNLRFGNSAQIVREASSPSMFGMCKSSTTASYSPFFSRILSTAICPSSARSTSQPKLVSIRVTTLALSGLSSATSTRTS
mmetsp:Transcript_14986/g.35346  ORF Transcript_14986/g.35346 Transcript_14986/m.35346 type:complete len:213 (-) Transcript_14986:461-1099(-)